MALQENNEDANGSAPSTDAPAPFTFGALAHQPKATAAPQGRDMDAVICCRCLRDVMACDL